MSLSAAIDESVKRLLRNNRMIDTGEITQVNVVTSAGSTGYSVNITCKNLNRTYENVPIVIPAAGDEYGFYTLPESGDWGIILFIDEDNPVIIGFLNKTQREVIVKKRVPELTISEWLIRHKSGTQIKFEADGGFEVVQTTKTAGRPSTFTPNCGVKFKSDGSFKMLNKLGYGIECDVDGKITIRSSSTINGTNTAGDING